MPSQVVDVAWHEFILFTKEYDIFCRRAIGRFLHHTPDEAMEKPTLAQDGIKRAWKFSCRRENIDPLRPIRLPTLFAIDALLEIEDGFKYSLLIVVRQAAVEASSMMPTQVAVEEGAAAAKYNKAMQNALPRAVVCGVMAPKLTLLIIDF